MELWRLVDDHKMLSLMNCILDMMLLVIRRNPNDKVNISEFTYYKWIVNLNCFEKRNSTDRYFTKFNFFYYQSVINVLTCNVNIIMERLSIFSDRQKYSLQHKPD